MTYHWSIHRLTEYLVEVSSQSDPRAAMRAALDHATEGLEAELGAVSLGAPGLPGAAGLPSAGETSGFGGGLAVPVGFLTGADGDVVDVPPLGAVHLATGSLATADGRRGVDGQLVLGRLHEPFSAEERQMLHGMSLTLGLALRTARAMAVERQRHRLLETLLQIQRAISARLPLAEVLDAVTAGASDLLGDRPVALLLAEGGGDRLGLASHRHLPVPDVAVLAAARRALDPAAPVPAPRRPDGGAEAGGLLAERVVVGGEVAGCLVARLTAEPVGHDPAELLSAFAQQVNLALTDARTLDAVREAHHDAVTSLPNRTLFLEHLDRELCAARADGRPLTVLFIDLDRFKAVNDILGHGAGDELLAGVARRILTCTGDADTVARLGGDEFAVLLAAGEDVGGRLADRIIAALGRPFDLVGGDVLVGASVGVATLRDAGQSASALLSDADVAMYWAKRGGRGRWVAFEPRMHADVADQLSLRTDLGRALANEQLWLAYQPLVDIASLRVEGIEALLRWSHPTRGPVPPSVFVPIAEESDTIRTLGAWTVERGLAQLAAWRGNLPGLHMAFNVSARQIVDPSLPAWFAGALDRQGLPGDAVTLEITESVLMSDPARAREALEDLRALGVRLSIDDFGTGYSSLSYLRQFPVDQVKIDRSFVAGLRPGAHDDIALLRSILDLCRSLRLQTVAEGIEEAHQLAVLTELGCDLGQGYFFARPQPASHDPHLLHLASHQRG